MGAASHHRAGADFADATAPGTALPRDAAARPVAYAHDFSEPDR
ncbi:hypothetical protein [Mycobacterium sp. URHD0025]|nr:hypothetical protein [Mycobacterium sp. URHD0025]